MLIQVSVPDAIVFRTCAASSAFAATKRLRRSRRLRHRRRRGRSNRRGLSSRAARTLSCASSTACLPLRNRLSRQVASIRARASKALAMRRHEVNGFGKVGQCRDILPFAGVGDASIPVSDRRVWGRGGSPRCNRPVPHRAARFCLGRSRGCCEDRGFFVEPDGFVAVGHPRSMFPSQIQAMPRRLTRRADVRLEFEGLVAIGARFLVTAAKVSRHRPARLQERRSAILEA